MIFPIEVQGLKAEEINWEGCEYSKCGRTDKGVSAFGQVIGIKVRSNRPLLEDVDTSANEHQEATNPAAAEGPVDGLPGISSEDVEAEPPAPFDDVADELPYLQILNRILPPDIRMLAWCPSPPPDFSARFSCEERRYRYFFTQPAFCPEPRSRDATPSSNLNARREGWLDIEAMRTAAQSFVGLHDFRNFCKMDPTKQLSNFQRRIFHADIEKVDPKSGPVGFVGGPDFCETARDISPDGQQATSTEIPVSTPTIYTFTVHGSAFLWHQVRHMAAILFLIGQGLEPPSLVHSLLDIAATPQKPQYEMASDAPLVLWDCIFPSPNSQDLHSDALPWVYAGDAHSIKHLSNKSDGKFGFGGVVDDLWKIWRQRKIDEVLAGSLLDLVVPQGEIQSQSQSQSQNQSQKAQGDLGAENKRHPPRSTKLFEGRDGYRLGGTYVPVLKKPRNERVEIVNERWAAGKGVEKLRKRERIREEKQKAEKVDQREGPADEV